MLLMVDKRILIVTGVLAVGAAAVVLTDLGRTPKADPRVGRSLLEGTAAVDVDKVDIAQGEAKLTLKRGADNTWRIGDDQGFPVDAGKVVRLIDDLSRTTVQASVAGGKESLGEFGLATPARLVLTAKDRDVLALALGEPRKSGGQYVGFNPDAKTDLQVYLASQVVSAPTEADSWELKQILDIPKEQLKAVTFRPAAPLGKKPAALARAQASEPMKLQDLPEGQKESGAVAGLESSFAGITFTKRYDPTNEEAISAFAGASATQVDTFDGRTYEVWVGSVGDKTKKYFLRVKGAASGDAADSKAKVQVINDLMAKHAFEVPAHVAQRFERGFADFVDMPPAPPKG